mmetsp:Transcript_21142/g.48567  ORF Transcript_21142/g.48567 Transcript_21142/m.48567 type:complete len:642 (+) Transcript_21142:169-2094(+)
MQWLGVLLGVATAWPSFVHAQRLPEMQEKCEAVRQSCVCNGSTGDVQACKYQCFVDTGLPDCIEQFEAGQGGHQPEGQNSSTVENVNGEESFDDVLEKCENVLDGCRCVDADDADKRGVWLNSLKPCREFSDLVLQICEGNCLAISQTPCDGIRKDCPCENANDDQLCANECFADAGLFDCIVNVDDVQVAATVQNDTNSFDFDEEMYEIEGEEEESWTNDHDHVHDEAEHAEWFDEDNAVWDVHHDDKDSHSTNPFGVSLDDCTQIFVDHVSNGQATSSIARSSNAVHQISLEPNEIGCFQILSSAAPGNLSPEEVTVKLSIRNSIYGRYEITQIPLDHDGQMYRGFAWQGDADGIYYCAAIGDKILFNEFPKGADGVWVDVQAEIVPEGEACFSDYISFSGIVPVDAPKSDGSSTAVHWSSHRYLLTAAHFEYKVATESKPVNLMGASQIDVSGDPGWDEYCTIEITWRDVEGIQRRFYAYVEADKDSWWIDEIRVYTDGSDGEDAIDDHTWYPDWVYFQDTKLEGKLGETFREDNFAIFNSNGDYVRFEQLQLAVFLPFSSEESNNHAHNELYEKEGEEEEGWAQDINEDVNEDDAEDIEVEDEWVDPEMLPMATDISSSDVPQEPETLTGAGGGLEA